MEYWSRFPANVRTFARPVVVKRDLELIAKHVPTAVVVIRPVGRIVNKWQPDVQKKSEADIGAHEMAVLSAGPKRPLVPLLFSIN